MGWLNMVRPCRNGIRKRCSRVLNISYVMRDSYETRMETVVNLWLKKRQCLENWSNTTDFHWQNCSKSLVLFFYIDALIVSKMSSKWNFKWSMNLETETTTCLRPPEKLWFYRIPSAKFCIELAKWKRSTEYNPCGVPIYGTTYM